MSDQIERYSEDRYACQLISAVNDSSLSPGTTHRAAQALVNAVKMNVQFLSPYSVLQAYGALTGASDRAEPTSPVINMREKIFSEFDRACKQTGWHPNAFDC